jgi:hypothetical protein
MNIEQVAIRILFIIIAISKTKDQNSIGGYSIEKVHS